MQICGSLPANVNDQILPYFLFAANFSVLLLPFVIVFSLPKKLQWKKIKQTIQQRQNMIYPS
jgi:F0F1-type ATP synthase membrane subunit b/b'